jgi:hypothetical protein
MSFSKKIAAFDLDGTLTESKQPLSVEMAELLVKLTAVTKVVIISGGSYAQLEKQFLPFLPRTGLVKDNLILLPTSGSQCYEYDHHSGQWKITTEEGFPADVKARVMAVVKEIVESGQYEIPPQRWGEYIEDRGTQITLSALGQEAPIAEKQKWDPDQRKRRKIKAVLNARLPEVDIGIGGTTSLDILPKGFNKAVGLKRLTERFGYRLADLAFVADEVFPGGNNYSVFEAGVETIRVNNPEETASVIKDWLS